jgi:hypothetical protein
MYKVTVEPMNSLYFLADRPEGTEWPVEEGVGLDIPANYDLWPEGSQAPEQILCVSTSDPKHYKLFKYSSDINPNEFTPTGMSFGGVFSSSSWKRFQETLSDRLRDEALRIVPDSR